MRGVDRVIPAIVAGLVLSFLLGILVGTEVTYWWSKRLGRKK